MAGSKTNYAEQRTANFWLGKSFSSTAPPTLYPRLIESTATVNGETWAGADTGECGGSTYQDRIQNKAAITNSSDSWTNDSGGAGKQNKITITITTAAGSDWGDVDMVILCDTYSTSGGNGILWADLTGGSATIASGNTVQFATGAITYSED